MDVILNILPGMQSYWSLIYTCALVVGFILVVAGVYSFSKNKQADGGIKAGVLLLISGLLLVNCTNFLDVFAMSMFNSGSAGEQELLSYADVDDENNYKEVYFSFAVTLIMIVGLFGFARGAYMLTKSAKDPNISYFTALTHMFGGTIAVNIVVFMEVIAKTLGGEVGQSIQNMVNIL